MATTGEGRGQSCAADEKAGVEGLACVDVDVVVVVSDGVVAVAIDVDVVEVVVVDVETKFGIDPVIGVGWGSPERKAACSVIIDGRKPVRAALTALSRSGEEVEGADGSGLCSSCLFMKPAVTALS